VAQVGNAAYLTMQASHAGVESRVMLVGFEPGRPGEPAFLVAGRPILRGHYEAIADEKAGFRVGDRVRIRRHEYEVVGLTRRMVSASGDPMLFVPLKDAQEVQFLKDNDALVNERERTAANPAFNRPGVPGLLEAVQASQAQSRQVNSVLVRVAAGADPGEVAGEIRRWKRLQAYTTAQMEEILVAKLIATSARQIGMFLVILSVVSAAIVAFIIYTLTVNKVREIAVLKLIGATNATIGGMILQQALGLGVIGFVVGRIVAGLWAPVFPKYVLLLPGDALRGFALVMTICALASVVAIRAALRVDPAEAIGG
jgi:putative ABC transport system permease protein